MLSSIADRVMQGIDDAASVPVIRERLELLKEQAEAIEKRNTELAAENAILKNRLNQLEEIEKLYAEQNQLIDLGPVKIKLDENGKRLPVYYCGQCGGIIQDTASMDSKGAGLLRVAGRGFVHCMKKCGFYTTSETLVKLSGEWEANQK